MKLELHPQAISNFNEKGLTLIPLCIECTFQKRSGVSKFPENYSVATINENEAGEIEQGMIDGLGRQIARYFNHQGRMTGLEVEGYEQFVKLCDAIHRAIRPPQVVSRTAIENETFGWIRGRFRGDADFDLIGTIIPRLEAAIEELVVWIPIAQLRLVSPLQIGKVLIQPITDKLIDKWRDDLLATMQDKQSEGAIQFIHQVNEMFGERFRRRYQGWSAGVMSLVAEPIMAGEIALHETERSLAMLRIFSEAAMSPKIRSSVAVMGKENIESTTMFFIRNNLMTSGSEARTDRAQWPLDLDNEFVGKANEAGLNVLSGLLSSAKLTKFQESILDSLMLFSRATRVRDLSDKLVYLLASLEGIFLKNTNEPIQQNLGERLATLLGKDLEQKKSIILNVKTVYDLRSAFLHHAQSFDDSNELETFMLNAWHAMMIVIQKHDKFATVADSVSAIDDLKLSPVM